MKSNKGEYHKYLFFNIFLAGIITICFFVLMTNIVGANPTPILRGPPGDRTGGGPAFSGNCNTRFVSENVTVYLDEQAYIVANYTFYNPLNQSVDQEILLPFHYSSRDPTDVVITINGEIINYSWQYHEFSDWSFSFPSDSYCDYEFYFDYYKMNRVMYAAVNFSISLGPFEKITVYVNYSRDYLLEKNWWGGGDYNSNYDLSRNRYLNSFVYLTRTGSLWDHPIQYANFEFYVNKSLCSGNFNDGIEYREFLYKTDQNNDYFRSDHDIVSTSYYTKFLTTINNSYESYYHLGMKYYDWVPNKDVGVVWNTQHPVAKIETSFDVGMDSIKVFLNGNTSYDEGRIVNFTWKFDETIISYNESICFNLTGKDEYEIFLTVTDEMGYTGTTSKKVKMPSTQDYVFAGFTEKELIIYSFTGTLIVLFVGLVFMVVKRNPTE